MSVPEGDLSEKGSPSPPHPQDTRIVIVNLILNALQYSSLEVDQLRFMFNGFPEEIEGCDIPVQDLLDRTEEDDPAVIVEINGRYIFRKDFKSVRVVEGDRVEFIHPSFGG